ncbi:RagB/SusD family nutrient uptake outer membrane protein [Marinifilum sp.]|uniref:RagB/SusD family nutrient uptake outer membrane protein n=1 Tax=Marinifilum sp. TaxID=2033137 RepID=UPI003BAD07FD
MRKIIYLFVLVGVLWSCDKDEYLDIKPYGVIVPDAVEDFRLLMDSRNGNVYGGSGGWVNIYDIDRAMTDDIKILDGMYEDYQNTNGRKYYDAIVWAENFGNDNEVDDIWLYIYNHIQQSHLYIEKLEDPDTDGSEADKQQLIAELKVHRAFAYFAAVNLYSKQYDAATAASDLGVPIRTSSVMSEQTPRESVQAVYDHIIQDLNEALASNALESTFPEKNWQATQAGAYAVQAKVYLQMGNYEAALTAANNCLALKSNLIDYNTLGSMPPNYLNEEMIFLKDHGGSSMWTDYYVSDELLAMYDAEDIRPNVRFSSDWRTGETIFEEGSYGNELSYIGPSVGEMYLISAECEARVGSFENAIDHLNTLRVNRYTTGNYVVLTTTDLPDAATTLAFVKDERRRELADKGVRLFDLKRYNALDNANITLTRVINGEVAATLEPNNNRWIVPIARYTITKAPEIEQSPR